MRAPAVIACGRKMEAAVFAIGSVLYGSVGQPVMQQL
jgi:hypothetical protein